MDSEKIKNIIEQLKKHQPNENPICESTILEVMNVLKKEVQHSNFIYFLLTNLKDKINNFIFIDAIIQALGLPDKLLGQKPIEIQKEKSSSHGNIDIYIGWKNYKLLIENKILSKEGDEQCKKYLEDYNISSKKEGIIIFLTLNGSNPKSLKHNDDRLIALSYSDLLLILKNIISILDDKNKKNKYFIKDYITSVERILGIGMREEEIPEIHDNTQLLFDNYRLLYVDEPLNSAYYNALDETSEIMKRLKKEIEIKLKNIDKELIKTSNFKLGMLNIAFYKKKWKIVNDDIDYTIGFFYEHAKSRRLLPAYNHCFVIRVKIGDKIEGLKKTDTLKKKAISFRNQFNDNIKESLKQIDIEQDIAKIQTGNQWIVTIESPDTDLDDKECYRDWMIRIVEVVGKLAQKATPILDKCVHEYLKAN